MRLPKFIRERRAVVNVENGDEYCFLWSIMAALHPVTNNGHKTSSYPHFSTELNYEGIHFPINFHDIPKFEKLNNLSINVYGIECDENSRKEEIVPLYVNKFKSNKPKIHLLIIENTDYDFDEKDDQINPMYHFAWIKNLSRFSF